MADERPFILLINLWMMTRTGTEVVTHDYALSLARRGWRVAVYAPRLGALAQTLEGAAQVTSDLASIEGEPDIVVGAHHTVMAPALVRFSAAPGLQICHDMLSWHDTALKLSRVRHAAVDRACRERVT